MLTKINVAATAKIQECKTHSAKLQVQRKWKQKHIKPFQFFKDILKRVFLKVRFWNVKGKDT